uniref:Uncharacterized protein n=1 Tax=Romanomermis culicivorax TaxID=13658 RepID=A0A915IIN5_ROMCU
MDAVVVAKGPPGVCTCTQKHHFGCHQHGPQKC